MLGAIQRDSYGYQTFFANRVGEIQKAGSLEDWWWIPGDLNITDIITRGAAPEDPQEDSVWQNGPGFLRQPAEEWPKKSAKEVIADAKEGIDKLKRKAFSAALTRAQAKKLQSSEMQKNHNNPDSKEPVALLRMSESMGGPPIQRAPAGSMVKQLVEERKFSSLAKLVRVIAWVWRAATKWKMKMKGSAATKAKWEAIPSKEEAKSRQAVLSVGVCEDTLRDLFLAAQEGVTFPDTTCSRLAVYKEKESGLYACGGRIQIFNEEETTVQILPYEAWISTLLAQEAHRANHEEIAGTLLRMRKKACIIKGRKLAKKVVDSCVICRKARARKCQQIMGDLPPERTKPARPFKYSRSIRTL